MNPNIDFLGICQLLKALRTVGFSENDIKRTSQKWNSDAEDARRPPVQIFCIKTAQEGDERYSSIQKQLWQAASQ